MTRLVLYALTLSAICYLFFGVSLAPVHALDPTPTFEPTSCDACGKCADVYGTPQPTPGDWRTCSKCLYGGPTADTMHMYPNPDKAYTILGCIQTNSGGFATFFVNMLSSLMGGVAFLGIVFGAFKIMLSRGDPEELVDGRRYIYASILALLVVLFAVFLVKMIGGSILKIPFLG